MDRFLADHYLVFVRPYYSANNGGKQFNHVRQLYGRLPLLSAGLYPPPRADRIYFLAAFYGLQQQILTDPAFRTETESFLGSLGWSKGEIQQGFEMIERISQHPQTIEEMLVHDANALELVGAYGIAKVFLFGGNHRLSVEETIHFYREQLRKVQFYSPNGQRLAAQRIAFSEAFIEQLSQE